MLVWIGLGVTLSQWKNEKFSTEAITSYLKTFKFAFCSNNSTYTEILEHLPLLLSLFILFGSS